MKITIDRFQGDYAVVEPEDLSFIDMPIQLVPEGTKEGDILSIGIDVAETDARRERVEKLMDDLWE